ncbi:hypothetical protein [Flavobacterium phycosphaerae]|uniref:hypothetical protein n=1 Tax=Flavobacterium phycosphaerae TaxID=2697515 RepID=UPI00138AD566|nr:hypothetical protein [Flavobacterium phycosphaerae]
MASITLMKNPILDINGNLRSQLGNDSFGYDSSNDVTSVKVSMPMLLNIVMIGNHNAKIIYLMNTVF